MARLLDTVSFVWSGSLTGSSIIGLNQLPGISRGTIIPPASIDTTGSIELEVASFSGSFSPVGVTIIPGTASMIDPWPVGDLHRLTADGVNAGATVNFDVIGQADGVPAEVAVGVATLPGKAGTARTFSDITTTRRNEAVLGNFG